MDVHDLYELTVQSPRMLVAFLRAVHGGAPHALGEDFAGTAAVSVEWTARVARATAIAADCDPCILERARGVPGVTLVARDVRAGAGVAESAVDVVFAGNFSIGELASRPDLVGYLKLSRARLAAGGIFVCDTYGGASAFRVGAVERTHAAPDGSLVRYTWEQREADPTTARVVNALHFRVLREGVVVEEFTDAFVYRWRLWSVTELRDALAEAGFAATEVYAEMGSGGSDGSLARPNPVRCASELGESFIVCVVGRTA